MLYLISWNLSKKYLLSSLLNRFVRFGALMPVLESLTIVRLVSRRKSPFNLRSPVFFKQIPSALFPLFIKINFFVYLSIQRYVCKVMERWRYNILSQFYILLRQKKLFLTLVLICKHFSTKIGGIILKFDSVKNCVIFHSIVSKCQIFDAFFFFLTRQPTIW